MGVLLYTQKKTILLTSGPGMTRKPQWMNDVHGNIFSLYCTKTNGCAHQIFFCIVWISRGWPYSLARNAPATWNPPKVTKHTAHLYSCHSYICMTSTQIYQKALSSFRQTDMHQHTRIVCVTVNCSPHLTCPNLDSADLYQAALVNMPWAMKLANICVRFVWLHSCLCVCLKGATWDLLTLHAHLHALLDWWRPEVIHTNGGWMME